MLGNHFKALVLCMIASAATLHAQPVKVITPLQMQLINIEEKFHSALHREEACDANLTEIVKAFGLIHEIRQEYIQKQLSVYEKLVHLQQMLLNRAQQEAQQRQISILQTAAGETLNVMIAATLDFIDASGQILSNDYSELGTLATFSRGMGARMKETARTYSVWSAMHNITQKHFSSHLTPEGWKIRLELKRMARMVDQLRQIDAFESRLWNELMSAPYALDELKTFCPRTYKTIRKFFSETGFQKTIQNAEVAASSFMDRWWATSVTTKRAIRDFGLAALGNELGFSSDPDDPLNIQSYVIPQLEAYAPLVKKLSVLSSATDVIAFKTYKTLSKCNFCTGLVQLFLSFKIYRLARGEEIRLKRLLQSNFLNFYTEYLHLIKTMPTGQVALFSKPLWILSTTAISMAVPWSGTFIALGQATLNLVYRLIEEILTGSEIYELRQNIKKLNFHRLIYRDALQELRNTQKRLDHIRKTIFSKLNCPLRPCIEEKMMLHLPKGKKISVEVIQHLEGLAGCWTSATPPMLVGPRTTGILKNAQPLTLYIKGNGPKLTANLHFPRGDIPLQMTYRSSYIRLSHRFTPKTYPIYVPSATPSEIHKAISRETRLILRVRPYRSIRFGDIIALAVQWTEETHEPPAPTPIQSITLHWGGFFTRPPIRVPDSFEFRRPGKNETVQKININDAVIIRAQSSWVPCKIIKNTFYVRLAPHEEPTAGQWIRLTETEPGSGIFESQPFHINFYRRGDRTTKALLVPETGVQMSELTALPPKTTTLTIQGVQELAPLTPGTPEAVEYGAASLFTPVRDRRLAIQYILLGDPFGKPMAGPVFKQKQPPTPPALAQIPVDIPYPPQDLPAYARKTILKYLREYEKVKKRAAQSDWADARVRYLYFLEIDRQKLTDAMARLKKALNQPGMRSNRGLIQSQLNQLKQLLATFDQNITHLKQSLRKRPPLTLERFRKREEIAKKIQLLESQLQALKQAQDAWLKARKAWLLISQAIEHQSEAGYDVSDLLANLRQVLKMVDRARSRYLALQKKYGTIEELETRIRELKRS